MNTVVVSGRVSNDAPKLAWAEAGRPQTTFTLIVEKPGREGSTFKRFVPVCVTGAKAEEAAGPLEAGAMLLLPGKLSYKAGNTKDSGKLVVLGVEVVSPTPARDTRAAEEGKR